VLDERQRGAPVQADALDGTEALVTVTIGGNDIGYVPLLVTAGLPDVLRWIPLLGNSIRELQDPAARAGALAEVAGALVRVGRTLRARAPQATVLFVDYLTLLPPTGPRTPYSAAQFTLGRHLAAELERLTAEAAAATGCGLVRAGAASRDHHAWSAQPWTTPFGLPIPGRPAPLHPNARGMRAVADLVLEALP
jgi:lysophospholipase L1-like esterase